MTEHLGGAELWAKREDVNSGLAFGGNKTRKLEYFLPDVFAQHTADLVELGRDIRDDDVIIDERFAGELYGVPVESTLWAMRLAGQLEGMLTDPVYEGKSMDGLIGLVRSGEIPRDAKVLYVHLGGAPALSAYASLFKHSQPVKL